VAAVDAASGEGSLATGARYEGQAKAVIAQPAEPSVEAEKNSPAGKSGRDHEVGDSSIAVEFDGAAIDPLREALATLDDRDYATAQRLFAAIGRKDVAEAIKEVRDRSVHHPNFLALVDRWRSPQGKQQHDRDPGLRASDPARDARSVVVAEHPIRPCSDRQRGFVCFDEGRDGLGLPIGRNQVEVERQMEAGQVRSIVCHQTIDWGGRPPQS
jgi:hypothetical protein